MRSKILITNPSGGNIGRKRPTLPPISANKAINQQNCFGRDGRCVHPHFQTGGHKAINPQKLPFRHTTVNMNTPTTKNPSLIRVVSVKEPVLPVRNPGKGPMKNHVKPIPRKKIDTAQSPKAQEKGMLTTVTEKIRSVVPQGGKKYVSNCNVACVGIALLSFMIGRKTKKAAKA